MNPVRVADDLLGIVAHLGARTLRVEQGGDPKSFAILLEDSEGVWRESAIIASVGEATVLRFALLGEVDLVGDFPQTGEFLFRRKDQVYEVFLTVSARNGSLSAELRFVESNSSIERTSTAMGPLKIGDRVGGYEIRERIGEGATGEVYTVEHVVLGVQRAMKVLGQKWLRSSHENGHRFLMEARLNSRIQHPGVVRVYEYGALKDGRPYLVMELLEGLPLKDFSKGKSLPPDVAVDIVEKVARALDAVHGAGVIHRDVSPSNIFIKKSGKKLDVTLMDFGAANLPESEDEVESAIENSGVRDVIFATPHYMAPEQFKGEMATIRSDIYGLGAVLFELLVGAPPFPEDDLQNLVRTVLFEEAPLPVSPHELLPVELENAVVRCLEKSPEQRYHDARELADDLLRINEILKRSGWKRWVQV